MEIVKLKKVLVSALKLANDYDYYVELPKEEYLRLCDIFGTYEFSWYFTEFDNLIKYYTNKDGWSYINYNWTKYKDWMKQIRRKNERQMETEREETAKA